MTTFFMLAALLAAIAALVLARPLWGRLGARRAPGLGGAVQALRLQLQQLGELHRAGALNDEQFAQSKALLETKLLAALSDPAEATAGDAVSRRPSMSLMGLLIVFMAAVTGGGYVWIGSPSIIEGGPGTAPTANRGGAAPAESGDAAPPHALNDEKVAEMIATFAERLKAKPDDGPGWLMLARSYVAIGKHADAVAAFKQAARLLPDDANLLADYADASAMANNRTLEGEPLALIARALKLDPVNAKALALAGSAAFERKDYKGAVAYWERLVAAEPADGPYAQQVQAGIAEARQLAGLPPAEKARTDDKSSTDDASRSAAGRISGKVVLASNLKGRVNADDTVFVFARALEGQRMPLAILRKRAQDLPLEFTLDDSLSMSPDAKLSSVKRVVVSARISRSGNAMPQPGDLQGSAAEVAVGSAGLTVEINQEVAK